MKDFLKENWFKIIGAYFVFGVVSGWFIFGYRFLEDSFGMLLLKTFLITTGLVFLFGWLVGWDWSETD